jgi:hypothetical protein
MIESCILCANGNDLPEGEYCRGCGREGLAFGLGAAVIKARGRQEPPTAPVIFDGGGGRERVAYDTYRNGFSKNHPPLWQHLEPWMRDAITVAYLQGKLDGVKS